MMMMMMMMTKQQQQHDRVVVVIPHYFSFMKNILQQLIYNLCCYCCIIIIIMILQQQSHYYYYFVQSFHYHNKGTGWDHRSSSQHRPLQQQQQYRKLGTSTTYSTFSTKNVLLSSSSKTTSTASDLRTKVSYNQQCLINRIQQQQQQSELNDKDEDDLGNEDHHKSSTTPTTITTLFPQTWVPMCSVYELDGSIPNSIYYFGQEYIIYQNTLLESTDPITMGWCIMDPTCTHRLAPLREGRIIPSTQHIQCSYHGWTFHGNTGTCTSIPQISNVDSDNDTSSSSNSSSSSKERYERILNNNQQCTAIKSYPCMVEKNILWAWLWPSSTDNNDNNNDNALVYTHLPEYYVQHIPNNTTTYTRMVPYSYDILIENIMDISHVPFAHHTLQGTRNDVNIIKPIIEKDIVPLYNDDNIQNGFQFHFTDATRQYQRSGTCTFKAPYMVHYAAEYITPSSSSSNITTTTTTTTDGVPKTFNLTTLLIPVSAGWSKIIIYSNFPPSTTTKKNKNNTTTTASINSSQPSNAVSDSTNKAVVVVKKKQKKSLVQRLFPLLFKLLPVWFLHTFSNRFLDSDLLLLHDQEMALIERQRQQNNSLKTKKTTTKKNRNDDVSFILDHYFMPSKADRSVVAIRKWIQQYASAVYTLSSRVSSSSDSSVSTSNSPITATTSTTPYINRPILFDRYHQHTKNCKYCNTMLERTIPKYKKYSYVVLGISILLLQYHIIFKLLCISSILSFPIYHSIDQSLRYGDFDHSQNH